jgi:hypothetical protein
MYHQTNILRNVVSWDVASCSSCVNRHFGGTYHLQLQVRKIREQGTNVSRWLQASSSLTDFSTLKMKAKRRFTQELHGATSQKTAFFIFTTVKTSDLTKILTVKISYKCRFSVFISDPEMYPPNF